MKIIVLGSGLVGAPMAVDLAKDSAFEVTVADNNQKNLDKHVNSNNLTTIKADLSDLNVLRKTIEPFDLILNALPGFMGFQTLKTVIESGKNIVDISFFPEDADDLDELAKQKNVTAIMDCGVAPGMSYILAAYAHHLMDKTDKIVIYVGGLPVVRTWPFEYKAVFSPIDVIEEYTRPARYIKNNQLVVMPALSETELINFEGVGMLEAFNSDGLRSMLKTIDCPDMIEKTLRYPGHVEIMKILRETGFFNTEETEVKGKKIRPIDLTAKLLFPAWELKKGEADLTVMQVIAEGWKNNKQIRYQYDLLDYYDPKTEVHSMARTTGYTATMAVRMIANKLFTDEGLIYPEYIGKYPDCVHFMLDGLKQREVVYLERVEE